MTRTPEKALLAAATLAAAAWLVDGLAGGRTHLAVFAALQPFCVLALLISLFAWGRLRLGRLAAEERRDAELERTERADQALFASAETEPFSIGRTAEQFERFVVPAFPLVLAAGLGGWTWRFFTRPAPPVAPADALLACSFLAGQAFFLFLFSRYLLGLAREPQARLARAPGIALGLASLGAFAGALTSVAAHLGLPAADRALALALTCALAVLAAENVVFFLASLYTPARRRGTNVPYESRLGALLTDPAAWARDLAQSFDYQFGLKVSESTSYRFLRTALVPLLLFQLLTFYLMSSLVFLGPHEEGVLERFGRPREGRWHLTSGFHLKAPWPFETVRRVPARRVLAVDVGFEAEADGDRRDLLLWTVPHYRQEDLFLTANRSPGGAGGEDATSVGLVSFNIPVEYRVTNLYAYAYGHADPAGLVRDLAYRALTREIAQRDLVDLLGPQRLAVSDAVRGQIQREADRLGAGVEILFVGVQGVHPPVPVADAFQSVVGALERREASILEARAYTNAILPVAAAHADRVRREAEAQRTRQRELAAADGALFERRLTAYRAAPAVFTSDLYLRTLRDALAGTRKYIVDHRNAREVLYFNFEEKPFPDLFELGPMPGEEAHP